MNETQAQARPVRPTLEEVEAYVHGKGYDDRGAANAFYGNFFYAYHDARVWRRADGTPVLDWKAEADAWHEKGPHYLEPEPRAAAPTPTAPIPVPAPVPEAPAAAPATLPALGALPPLEIADVASLAAVLSEYGRKEDALAIVSRLAEMTERVKMDGPDRRMAPCDAEGAGR